MNDNLKPAFKLARAVKTLPTVELEWEDKPGNLVGPSASAPLERASKVLPTVTLELDEQATQHEKPADDGANKRSA